MQRPTHEDDSLTDLLFNAIDHGDFSTVRYELERGADLKTTIEVDNGRMTALQLAVDHYDSKKHNARDRLNIIFSLLNKIKLLSSSETEYAEFGVNDAFITAVDFILNPVIDHFLALGFPVDCALPQIIKFIANCSSPISGAEQKLSETFSDTVQLCLKLIPYCKLETLEEIRAATQDVEQKIKYVYNRAAQRQVTLITNSLHRLNETIKIYINASSSSLSQETSLRENEKIDGLDDDEKKEQGKNKKKKKKKKKKTANEKTKTEKETLQEKITPKETEMAELVEQSEETQETEDIEPPEEIQPEPLGFSTPPARSRRSTITIMTDEALSVFKKQLITEIHEPSTSSASSSQWNSPDTTPGTTPSSTRAHTPIQEEEVEKGIPLLASVQCPPGFYFVMGMQVANLLTMEELPRSLTFFRPLVGVSEKLQQLSQPEFSCLQWHAYILVNKKQEASLFFEKPSLSLTVQGAASLIYDMRRQALSAIYFSQDENVSYYPLLKPRTTYVNLGFQSGSQQPLLTYPVCTADYFTQKSFLSFLLSNLYSIKETEKLETLIKALGQLITQHNTDQHLVESMSSILYNFFPEDKVKEVALSLTRIIQFPQNFNCSSSPDSTTQRRNKTC